MKNLFSKYLKERSNNRPIRIGNQVEHNGVIAPTDSLAVVDEPITFTSDVDMSNATIILPNGIFNYGNVYYISDSMGDNATGEKGNPNKPYKTFAAVTALYANNDIIEILDGSIVATGNTSLNDNSVVNIILNDNVTLTGFVYTPSVNAHKLNISGNGNITSFGYKPTETYSGTCNIYCNTFYTAGGTTTIKSGELQINCLNYIFSTLNSVVIGDTVSTNESYKSFILNAVTMTGTSGIRPIDIATYLFNVNLQINTDTFYTPGAAGDSFFGTYNARIKNSNFSINIETLLAPNLDWLIYWTSTRPAVDFLNFNVDINIGYYKGPASIFGSFGPGEHVSGAGLNSRFRFHCDHYHCTRATASVVKNITNLDRPTQNYFIEISGNYISDTVPMLLLVENMQCRYLFTGTFKTVAAVPAISITVSNSADARLNLENAKFIVVAGQKVVEATGASNVYCMNVVTNSTTTDAEVTEIGQAIVRNANFV